jgi:phosphatidylserine decarboxylase
MNFDNLKIRLQYILPKHMLTRLVGLLADARLGKVTTYAIKKFAQIYHINIDEAAQNVEEFKKFNEFFSRALKAGVRPIDNAQNSIVFPADGHINAYGKLKENLQMQAKEHYFTVEALLASEDSGKIFKNGEFITVYLSPQDYHRVHMPFAGKLLEMTYVPGELFSVNPLYTKNIPELFSRNERVVCLFETECGKMAVVFVGATIVRSIITSWAGVVAPNRSSQITTFDYRQQNIQFAKGDEIGRFMMGSTVICLFEKNKTAFIDTLENEQPVRMGQKMGIKQ